MRMASTRRDALRLLALGGAAAMAMPRVAFAAAETEKRFVFFILRGGMDGLAALMPVGDPGFAALRGEFNAPQNAVPLDDTFGLHADLAPLKAYYDAGTLLPVHAVASSHRGRSHFEAQDMLEAGLDRPNSSTAGWLNRLLTEQERAAGRKRLGLALGPTIPFALRGPVAIASAAPDTMRDVPAGFFDRMASLWAEDPVLGPALGEAAAEPGMMMEKGVQAVVRLARLAAERLVQPSGPRIAVIEMNGFDTHTAEANRLALQFRILSQAMAAMAEGLKPVWQDTAILAVSEFGRTARPNGTGGTDHGTAGTGFVLGGAVKGGRVLSDWPGVKPSQLYEGRDLAPTLHVASLYKAIAARHFGLDGRAQMARLFPDAGGVAVADIMRG